MTDKNDKDPHEQRRVGDPLITSISWDASSLLANLESDLLNPVDAIISNSEIIAEADDYQRRVTLASSTMKAAHILEEIIQKLLELARIASKTFKLNPETTSLHSLSHESALLAQSIRHGGQGLRVDIQIESDDAMVDCDRGRIVHLISSAIILVGALTRAARVKILLRANQMDGDMACAWLVQIPEAMAGPAVRDALEYPESELPRAAKRALEILFTESLASALGVALSTIDLPPGIQIAAKLPVVRRAPPPDTQRLFRELEAGRIVIVDEPPDGFTLLPTTFTEVPDLNKLKDFVRDKNANLVVLHHNELTRPGTIAKRLAYCFESRVPVLLRASSLTYEQFHRYRNHVDAVILEPSDPAVLARYIVGLSQHDRRHNRRPADIH